MTGIFIPVLLTAAIATSVSSSAPPPDRVAVAIKDALFAENPKEHYLVVSDQFEAMITIGTSFEELLNLNQDQEFSYTRAQMIAILEEEWAILKGEKTRNWDLDE